MKWSDLTQEQKEQFQKRLVSDGRVISDTNDKVIEKYNLSNETRQLVESAAQSIYDAFTIMLREMAKAVKDECEVRDACMALMNVVPAVLQASADITANATRDILDKHFS